MTSDTGPSPKTPSSVISADPSKERTAAQMRALAWWLDASIPVPFTKFRIGLDALVGLVPGIGDAAGAAASGLILVQAWRMGASPWTLLRMLFNVVLETVIGLVPVLGDLFDMAFKSNLRNVQLALAQVDSSGQAKDHRGARAGLGWLVAIAIAILAIVVLCIGGLVAWIL